MTPEIPTEPWTENATAEEILEVTFDAIEDPIFLLGHEGRILRANRAAARFLEMDTDELAGHRCFELVHHTATYIDGCPYVASMRSHRREWYSLEMGGRWWRVTVDPVIEAGEVVGAVHIITDIQEIKEADQLRARLGAVIAETTEAVVSLDQDGRVTGWNRGAEEIFGYTATEMEESPADRLVPADRRDEFRALIARVRQGERTDRFETTWVSKEGDDLELSVSFSPIRDPSGTVTGISFVAGDLTPQREAERALVAYLSEATMRLRHPVEVLRAQLDDLRHYIADGTLTPDEIATALQVQETAADAIVATLTELNEAIVSGRSEIPDAYREFLRG
ncbi:MAG: PAS domain-containing protein [Methanomicrobiales archaeon]